MSKLRMVEYKPAHQPWFEKLNRAWIEKYFEMEERDTEALTEPEKYLIEKGGAVLVAEYNDVVAGVAGLKKVDALTYEFTKMAVDENFRRKGIAEQLCYASFRKAKELGAKIIILYSNSVLTPAITLYRKLGFKHLPVGNSEYKRSDVKMMISIEDAIEVADKYQQPVGL